MHVNFLMVIIVIVSFSNFVENKNYNSVIVIYFWLIFHCLIPEIKASVKQLHNLLFELYVTDYL